MVEFQLLSVPIGLILGLGMTRIMTGAITAIRNREHIKLHWLPFIWATSFMILLLAFFCVLWDLKEYFEAIGIGWTWDYYGPQVLHAVFIFLGAGLLLPVSREPNTDCFLKDFNKHGRLALIPLIAMHLMAWPMNMYMSNVPLFHKANYLNFIMIAVIFVGYKSTRLTWQTIAASVYLTILIYAMFNVWSRPGHSHLEDYKPNDDPRFKKTTHHFPEIREPYQNPFAGSGLRPAQLCRSGGKTKIAAWPSPKRGFNPRTPILCHWVFCDFSARLPCHGQSA